uniref:Microtubule-associated protein n=1 Tax=Salarias fasciatus TaxID=181472 RepID=A0A672JMQ8_SALFA
MDLSLRDALGGGGGGVQGGAPAESLLKRDFMATLEKESYDDKVGETVSKSDYRPLVDGKDTKSAACLLIIYLFVFLFFVVVFFMSSGFSQSGMGGTMGSGLPPFQTSMTPSLGQTGMTGMMGMTGMTGKSPATDTQKSSGLFGVENKTSTNTSGNSPFKIKSDNKDKLEKTDLLTGKTEKIDTSDKKEEQQKKDNGPDKNQKSENILKNEEKNEKINTDKNNKANEKAEKVDKPEKTNKDEKKEEEKKPAETKDEKGGKSTAKSPTGSGGKTLPSPDSKSKPDVGSTKPNSAKSRPSTLSTNGEANSAKRPSPTTASANKKSPVPKATTPTAAKRPPTATGSNKAAKVSGRKRPPVPKATPTPRPTANKNGSSATAASKTAARPRPASTATPAAPASSTNGDGTHRRRVITKPPVPKQTPLEKKPAVPRAPRNPRPINAPTPDLKNVRSKIGSIDNIKYQPGLPKYCGVNSNIHSALYVIHVLLGGCENITQPILNKKVDVSKVTSKCGSKDNIKHKPGGGDVKIESHKLSIKAKSKIGSLDNVGQGNGQTNGHKVSLQNGTCKQSLCSAPTTDPAGVAKATAPGGVTKENGVKEPTTNPFGGDGLREPLSIDKRITETSECKHKHTCTRAHTHTQRKPCQEAGGISC